MPDDRGPVVARLVPGDDLASTLASMGLRSSQPVLVLVGGADAMGPDLVARLEHLLIDHLLPVLRDRGAIVIDGGTDAGVMRAVGRACARTEPGLTLLGVAAEATVTALEPHHTHLLLVPGESFGDESPWLADAAGVLAGAHGSVTLLVNGGEVALRDASESLRRGRPLVVLTGSGRTADAIAAAAHVHAGQAVDPVLRSIAESPHTRFVSIDDGMTLSRLVDHLLTGLSA